MKFSFLPFLGILFLFACQDPVLTTPESCNFTHDSTNYFSITANPGASVQAYNVFCKKVDVFGIDIYGSGLVADAKLLHAANVMAQYLDNDGDGTPDNQTVVDAIIMNNAAMVMFLDSGSPAEASFYQSLPPGFSAQSLYDIETIPDWNMSGSFDATLKEVLHLITQTGYANVYPDVFGEVAGSSIADAMDVARGGYFEDVPASYPAGAWYTYDDQTCDYACQVTEYTYWALTSILGAQDYSGRLDEIQNEWQLNTAALVMASDTSVYNLLTDPQYKFPTVLPDGRYMQ